MTDRTPAKGRRTDPKGTGDDRDGAPEASEGIPSGAAAAQPVGSRRERYLVAPLEMPPMSGAPAEPSFADGLFAQLAADPATTVHRIITAAADAGATSFPKVAVVEMDADRAAMFNALPAVHVEPDLPLQYAQPISTPTAMTFADPGVIPPGDIAPVAFLVVGDDGKALEGAAVYLMSEAFPLRGITGDDGTVVIDVPAGALPTLNGVYVKPRYDYWAVWLGRPQVTVDAPNLVSCPSFAETFPGFPQRQVDGWARRALRLDALPPTFRGDGVRIAIIDSGTSVEHPDLTGRITAGCDVSGPVEGSWRVDTVGYGSHAAGIIGGSDNGYGIVGVVPEAELHSCKIFPGGRFSDLIDAIDYCIEQRIDVINLSLGNPQPSQVLAYKIEQARQAGIACVVAAGNSAGNVCFPASMPTVLAVAAIGKLGEYPPESYHATQVHGVPTADGYFSASFTSFGPEIDVCAPGVAIVSSVPPTNYAAWDGTSFATPYVSGLAALLLAHHPEFRSRFTERDSGRVDRLFELIRSSCRPLALGDPGRSGAGLPDAVAALGLIPPVTTSPPANPILAELWVQMAQSGLIPATVPTVSPAAAMMANSMMSGPMMGWPAAPNADAGRAVGDPASRPGATLTAPSTEPLDPLRVAMRAAGLLPQDGSN